MNEIKLAILRDIGLSNNGYTDRGSVIFRVVDSAPKKVHLTEVRANFDSLVNYGHLKLLGKAGARVFFCLPEDYDNVKAMMQELTASL